MFDPQLVPPVKSYLSEVCQLLERVSPEAIAQVITLLLEANRRQCQLFLMGNGGSAATASHFACDLGKGTIVGDQPRFRVSALTDNVPLMTAWGNDTSYDNIFAQQLAGLVQPGDLVVGISGSGNSPNVLNAIRLARSRGAVTVGLTGFDGGRLGRLVDYNLHVPSTCMEQVEDVHMVLTHLLCTQIRAHLMEDLARREAPLLPTHAVKGVGQRLVEQLTHSLQITLASLWLLDETEQGLVLRATSSIRHLGGSLAPPGTRLSLALLPPHARVLSEGRHLTLQQPPDGPGLVSAEAQAGLPREARSVILLPIQLDEKARGVVSLIEMRDEERAPMTVDKVQTGFGLLQAWCRRAPVRPVRDPQPVSERGVVA